MFFQGHIENGGVVLDEPVSLPNGTIVRIQPLAAAKEEQESGGPVVADTDQPSTAGLMARAWEAITRPISKENVPLVVDPDDYPLF